VNRSEDTAYPLLRYLTLPVVAVTTSAEGNANGMIANSAQRASLVPAIPRISLYISKVNHTHDLVYRSGVMGIHLLGRDQWDLIWRLGMQSGRDTSKLNGLQLRTGETGCPLLVDVVGAFECIVINAMDAGASTFFLGDVIGASWSSGHEVMTSDYFRAHMSDAMKQIYEARLAAAQVVLEPLARTVDGKRWPGAVVAP
jgi:flavin reductase (DIM6/NTAB) family NADH-FMN oxidoreductase RutF